jgi:hypothetical protein
LAEFPRDPGTIGGQELLEVDPIADLYKVEAGPTVHLAPAVERPAPR